MFRLLLWCLLGCGAHGEVMSQSVWERFTVDDTFRGADGVRLADFDADGLLDVVCGWEESGVVRLYLNPGADRATGAWPAVTVGRSSSPEDAVPVDIDGDGDWDVVSCHEGRTKKVLVHINRASEQSSDSLMDETNWSTVELKQLAGKAWMFAAPIRVGGKTCLVVGSKGTGASISLVIPPQQIDGQGAVISTDSMTDWQVKTMRQAGWIMSLRVTDLDGDGDEDIVYSDRKGPTRGVGWLEQAGTEGGWTDHAVIGGKYEFMFLDIVPATAGGEMPELLTSTRDRVWLVSRFRQGAWQTEAKENPPGVPFGKAIARVGSNDLVMTANTVAGNVPRRPGVWLRRGESPWQAIGAKAGGKYDRIEVIDLDGDGLLDLMTCEERQNLGVIWYRNPGISNGWSENTEDAAGKVR